MKVRYTPVSFSSPLERNRTMKMYILSCMCSKCESFDASETEVIVNEAYFWKILQEGEGVNSSYKKLIFEKTFYLCGVNETEEPSTLSVGIDPENEFFVYARLKVPCCKSNIILHGDDVKDLLEYLAINIEHFLQAEEKKSINISDDIALQEYEQRLFKLYIFSKDVIIDECSLKKLRHLRAHIKRYIGALENTMITYERYFLTLLSRFYHGKTTQETFDLSKTE